MNTNRELISSTMDSVMEISTTTKRKVGGKQFSLSLKAINKNNLTNKRNTSYFSPDVSTSKVTPTKEPKYFRSIFKKNVHKLIIVLSFFESLSQYSKEQLRQRVEYYKMRRNTLFPLFPDDFMIAKWGQFNQLLLFLFSLLYPLHLAGQLDISNLLYVYDSIFIVDGLLMFVTAYVDENYNLVTQYQSIFLHYLQTWLLLDILSLMPFQYFSNNPHYMYFKLFRIIKYFFQTPQKNYKGQRFYHTNPQDSFNVDQSLQLTDGWIFLFNVLMNACLLIHVFGCVFLQVENQPDYIESIYWSAQTLFTVGYGDVKQDAFLSVIWIIVSIGYYSVKVGDFAKLLSQSNIQMMDDQTFLFDRLAYSTYVPDDLREKVQQYIRTNQQHNSFWQGEILEMVNEFPKHLQNYFTLSVMLDLCLKIPLFLQDVHYTTLLLKSSRLITYEKGDLIYRKGQTANEIYYLIKGFVRIESHNKYPLINIMEGSLFGEFEALNDQWRLTFAIAHQRSLILMIQYKAFHQCYQESKVLHFEIQQFYARRRQLMIQQLKNERIESKRLKRKNVIVFKNDDQQLSPEMYKTNLQKQQYLTTQLYNNQLLQRTLGQAQLKLQKILLKFKNCVSKVIDLNRQIDITPPEDWKDLNEYQLITKVIPTKTLQLRNKSFRQSNRQSRLSFSALSFNRKLHYSNYIQTRQQEINIQRKIVLHARMQKERFQPIQQILSNNNFGKGKFTLLSSKYRVVAKQSEELKVSSDFVDKFKQLRKEIKQVNNVWLKGSLLKFELYKYHN